MSLSHSSEGGSKQELLNSGSEIIEASVEPDDEAEESAGREIEPALVVEKKSGGKRKHEISPKTQDAFSNFLERHGINQLREAGAANWQPKEVKRLLLEIIQDYITTHNAPESKAELLEAKKLEENVREMPDGEVKHLVEKLARAHREDTTVELLRMADVKTRGYENGSLEIRAAINKGRKTFVIDFSVPLSETLEQVVNSGEPAEKQKLSEAFRRMLAENEGSLEYTSAVLSSGQEDSAALVYLADNRKNEIPFSEAKAKVLEVLKEKDLILECLKYRKEFPDVNYNGYYYHKEEELEKGVPVRHLKHEVNETGKLTGGFYAKPGNSEAVLEQRQANFVLAVFEGIHTRELELLLEQGEEIVQNYFKFKNLSRREKLSELSPEERAKVPDYIETFEAVALCFGKPSKIQEAFGRALEERYAGKERPAEPEDRLVTPDGLVSMMEDLFGKVTFAEIEHIIGTFNEREEERFYRLILKKLNRSSEVSRAQRLLEFYEEDGMEPISDLEILKQAVIAAFDRAKEIEERPGYAEQVSNPQLQEIEKFNLEAGKKAAVVLEKKSGRKFLGVNIEKEVKNKNHRNEFLLPVNAGQEVNSAQAVLVQNAVEAFFEKQKGFLPAIKVFNPAGLPRLQFSYGKEAETKTILEMESKMDFESLVVSRLLMHKFIAQKEREQKNNSTWEALPKGERNAINKVRAILLNTGLPNVGERLLQRAIREELKPLKKPIKARGEAQEKELPILQPEILAPEESLPERVIEFGQEADKYSDEVLLRHPAMQKAQELIIQNLQTRFETLTKHATAAEKEQLEALYMQVGELEWTLARRAVFHMFKIGSNLHLIEEGKNK